METKNRKILQQKYKLIKIKDINENELVKRGHKYIRVNKKFPVRKKLCYKIKLKSGAEFICSGDHRFPSSNGLNSINSGLVVGDKLSSL